MVSEAARDKRPRNGLAQPPHEIVRESQGNGNDNWDAMDQSSQNSKAKLSGE